MNERYQNLMYGDWKFASPEFLNLVRQLDTIVNITNIVPLYYQGTIAGSEFLTYAATKLYLSFYFIATSPGGVVAASNSIVMYDEGNVISSYASHNTIYYDAVAVAARYNGVTITIKNTYFSRIVANSYNYLIFNGYRLTIA